MKTKYFSVVILAGLSLGIYNCSSMDSYGVKNDTQNFRNKKKYKLEANIDLENQKEFINQQKLQPEKIKWWVKGLLSVGIIGMIYSITHNTGNSTSFINKCKIKAFNGTHFFGRDKYNQRYEYILPLNTLCCTPMFDQIVLIDENYNINEENLYTFESFENINLNRFCIEKKNSSTYDSNECLKLNNKLTRWNYLWAKDFSAAYDPCTKKGRQGAGREGLYLSIVLAIIYLLFIAIFLCLYYHWRKARSRYHKL